MRLDRLKYHRFDDFSAGIASGSFLTRGMVICPCSMGTLASLAGGHSENLIQRAADVHLKEHRKLIVVPRETPISSIQLDNMRRLAEAGVVVLPAMPGYYHGAQTIPDLVDFVVARIADQLGVEHRLMKRWGTPADPA
jgi:4-hydroxy-3-polyprenylbenzoate decarboxylase